MEITEQEVNYEKYCKLCKHGDKNEFQDPCADCLDMPFNRGSEKPLMFEKS